MAGSGMRGAVTVADVMDLSVMKGTRIIAGSRGLSRRVSAISVIAGTEMTEWVKSGAIAISTGHPFAHLGPEASRIIDELADCGVACLAIRLGRYITELPDTILAQANERGLPIIQLSDRHAFDEIIIDVLHELETYRVSHAESVQDAYAAVVADYLRRGSLRDVVTGLHDVLRGRVVIYNEFGDVILDSHPDSPQLPLDADTLHFPFGHVVMDHDKQGITIRLGSEQTPIGWIRVASSHEEFGHTSVSIMEAVLDVVTVAVRQSGVIHELIGPYVNEFLADLVADDPIRVERGVERIVASGFVAGEAYEVAVVAVWGASGDAGQRTAARVRQRIQAAAAHACTTSDAFKRSVVVGRVGDEVVVLAGEGTVQPFVTSVLHRTEQFSVASPKDRMPTVTVGLGGPLASLQEVRHGYLQAKMAAVSARAGGDRVTRKFEDIGLIGSLIIGNDVHGLVDLCYGVLSGLRTLPARERRVYLQTLEILIESNCNFAETARQLYCHYNTIRYRVARLEELVGPFTTNVRIRTNLALCFEILSLVDSNVSLLDRLQQASDHDGDTDADDWSDTPDKRHHGKE